jgi:hypothetical protein
VWNDREPYFFSPLGDSRESLFFHGAVAVTYVCNCRQAWFSLHRLQLHLRRSNFYPADFLPERPNLSFKELGGLKHRLIVGASPTMRAFISNQARAMDGVFFRGFDKMALL